MAPPPQSVLSHFITSVAGEVFVYLVASSPTSVCTTDPLQLNVLSHRPRDIKIPAGSLMPPVTGVSRSAHTGSAGLASQPSVPWAPSWVRVASVPAWTRVRCTSKAADD